MSHKITVLIFCVKITFLFLQCGSPASSRRALHSDVSNIAVVVTPDMAKISRSGKMSWPTTIWNVVKFLRCVSQHHLMCAMRYALLVKAAMHGCVKVQYVGNGRTLFDLKFERRL